MVCAIEPVRHPPVAREHQPRRTSMPRSWSGIEPECAQRRLQFGLRHDAGAASGERLGDAFVDVNVASRGA